jgi:hypothetical protein
MHLVTLRDRLAVGIGCFQPVATWSKRLGFNSLIPTQSRTICSPGPHVQQSLLKSPGNSRFAAH